MKKLLLTAVTLLFFIPSFSQITLGTADFPHSGNIDTVSLATAFSGMNYLTTDTNYYWDFQNLDSTTTGMRIDTFVSVSSTGSIFSLYFGFLNPANHALHKADVNLGPLSITGVYDFFQNTSANYHQSGFGGSPNGLPITLPVSQIPLGYTPSDVIYKFPLKFGNVDSCAPVDTLGLAGFLYFRGEKTRHNEVDGWGKVRTPYGTFDCLRVKSIVHEHDSAYIDTLGFGFAINQPERIEYKWLAKSIGEPALQIVTTGGTVSEISYYGNPVCPNTSFTMPQDTIYEGTTLNFTNTTDRPSNYQWRIDGTPFSTAQDTAYTFNNPGTYTVTLVATHLNCTERMSKVITVLYTNCTLAASFQSTDTIFDQTNLSFTNTTAPVSSYGAYKWTVNGTSFATTQNAAYQFNTPGTYIVKMVATDINCVDSSSKLITVLYSNCTLAASFQSSDTIFDQTNLSFTNTSAPVSSYGTYLWEVDGGAFATTKNAAYQFNTVGTYVVKMVATDLNCLDSSSKIITVYYSQCNLQTVFNSSSQTVYKGESVSFSGSSPAPVTYAWSFNDSLFSTAKDTSLNFQKTGTYKVTLVTNHLNCTDSITQYITVLPPDFAFEVYPNPISSDFHIFCSLPSSTDIRVEMTNELGQNVLTNEWYNLSAGEHNLFLSIPPSSLASAVYYMKVKWKNGEFVKNLLVTKE